MSVIRGFPSGSVVKNSPVMQETQEMQVQSLGWEDPLEKGMATHSSILPGESHGQRSLAAYSPRGLKESDTTESDLAHNVGQAPDKEPCLSLFL